MMGLVVADLIAKLGLDKSGFDRGMDQSQKKAMTWGDGLKKAQTAAAVGLTAIVGVAAKGVLSYEQLTASVAALQRQSKVSATDASLLVGQWARYGVSIEAGGRATMMLSKQMDAANTGTQTSIDSFARLGITLDDLKTMSPYQVLEEVRSKLSELPPGAERTSLSAKLLGRGFMSMSKWIAASSTDLDALNKQLKGTGQVMDETELARAKEDLKQMALLQVDLRGLLVDVGRSAVPIIRDLVPGLKKLLAVVKPLAPHLVEIGGALAAFLVVSKVATGLGAMVGFLQTMKTLIVGGKLASGLADVAAAGSGGGFVKSGEKTVAQSLLGGGGAAAAGGGAAAAGGVGIVGGVILPVAIMSIAAVVLGKLYGDRALKPGAQVPPGATGGAGMYKWSGGVKPPDTSKADAAAAAALGDAMSNLGAKAATAVGPAFTRIRAQMTNIQSLIDKGFKFGDIKAPHTDSQLRSIRDQIMSTLHTTQKQADRIMASMFKDWRPQNQLIPKIDRAAVAVENRIAALRRRAGKDIRMGNLDATNMLNEIGRISAALDGVHGAARTAGNAVANALGAKSGVQSQSYRGHFMAAGGYVPARPGGTQVVLGEGGEGETVTPDSKMGRGGTVLNINVANVHGTDRAAATKLANMAGEIFMQQVRFA